MRTCGQCGLGTKDKDGLVICYKYKTRNKPDQDKRECPFFIRAVIEDGEVLSPLQHLLIIEAERKAFKRRGYSD
jgi:hypothetical protein